MSFFQRQGRELIHPRTELLQFEFELLSELKGRPLFPTSGLYMLYRLMAAGIDTALTGFTGYAGQVHHDPEYEARVFNCLEEQGRITRIHC